jgi:hypothetical protein
MGRLLILASEPQTLRSAASGVNDVQEWSKPLADSLLVPDVTRWIPELTIEVTAIFQCNSPAPELSKGDRFLNPTQSQIGYFQEIFNDFVIAHDRILYQRQIHRCYTPTIALPTSFANRKAEYREKNDGGFDQAANSARFAMCHTRTGDVTGFDSGAGVAANTQELQLRIERGRRTYAPLEPSLATFSTIEIEAGVNYPSEVSGVLWPGWAGTIAFEYAVYTDLTIPGFPADNEFKQNPSIYAPPQRPCDGGGSDDPDGPLDPIIL